MDLNYEQFLDLERKMKRSGAFFYTIRRLLENESDVWLYSGFEFGVHQGKGKLLWDDLTKGLDKEYNVIVNYRRGFEVWSFVIPTQIPEKFKQELEKLYEDSDTVGADTQT